MATKSKSREPLAVDASLAELRIHLGDALVAANRVELAKFSRPLLNRTEIHALKALTTEVIETHWTQIARAMARLAGTVVAVTEPERP